VKELTSRAESFPVSKIKVIYNGIDGLDRGPDHRTSRELTQEFGIPHDHKVIGIVANLRPMKRHATLIHAAERILKTRQDVDFVLVGEGPLRGELEALIAAKGLRRHFHFAGRREAIQPLLSIFQVGVNCSANEGLSNAIMEYMAYGVPCVVSRAGGNLELVEHGVNGYTFELDDDQALSGYILELLGNQEMRERFSARSKEIVHKRLSTARMVREYEEYFLGLLSAGETWTPERFARVRDSGSASCESGTSDR
jgi:glycosyltransferase involved in cell wall biosynthesis